jgi:hypothetical protein
MIATYYPSSKITHNLKDMEFKNFKNSKHFKKIKFSRTLHHMLMGCNVHDIQNKVVFNDIRNKKLK